MKTQIPFVGPSYEARSVNVDAQRTLNCFIEMDNASTRAPVALYGTLGLRKVATLPTGPVRNSIAEKGFVWVVSGNAVYRVDTSYAVTTVGTINTSSGQISMASNGSEIIIVDGINGYIISTTSSTVAQITNAAFPNGVKRAAYNDGYFLVAGDGSQKSLDCSRERNGTA
jgi:hypothetical protein